MKKFAVTCLAVLLSVFVGLAATGCSKKKNVKSSNTQAGVVSNGGVAVKKGDMLYFIGGAQEAGANKVAASSIYSVKVDNEGKFVSDPVVFVNAVAGFEFGSLHIFGDYLYYVVPSSSKNSKGETLSGILDFYRISLSGGKAQKLYSTSSNEEEEYNYAYYASGSQDLYLVVYEKTAKTIVSVDIGTHPKATTIATDVTGVVFAENGATDGANKYVFYTHAKDKKADDQTGNVVERMLPNGEGKTEISVAKKTYSLLSIRGGKLLFAESDKIYATSGESKLDQNTTIVSYLATSSYKDVILFNDHLIAKNEDKNLVYVSWETGALKEHKICNADATLLCEDNGKLYYIASSELYVVELKKDAEPLKLANQKIEAPDGNIMPEIVDGYMYFINKDGEALNMHRISVNATETKDSQKLVK